MTAGFQTFDASGALQADTPDSNTRFGGSLYIAANSSGSISVPLFSEGTPWHFVIVAGGVGRSRLPKIVLTGSTLSWSYPITTNSLPVTVLYGVK